MEIASDRVCYLAAYRAHATTVRNRRRDRIRVHSDVLSSQFRNPWRVILQSWMSTTTSTQHLCQYAGLRGARWTRDKLFFIMKISVRRLTKVTSCCKRSTAAWTIKSEQKKKIKKQQQQKYAKSIVKKITLLKKVSSPISVLIASSPTCRVSMCALRRK